jgi:hypothetical protein
MKVLLAAIIFLSFIACKNDVKSTTKITSPNLSDTNNLKSKDSLDVDTTYAQGINVPESVSLFFRNAEDTLWGYVLRSYIHSHKREVFSIDSFKSILNKVEFEVFNCDKYICGYKREFNKMYNFNYV